jgi:hypothetical protein
MPKRNDKRYDAVTLRLLEKFILAFEVERLGDQEVEVKIKVKVKIL